MSTRDDSLSVPWADSPASVSMPQPSSASTTPRGGDALGRAAMQVEQYQEAVNAAIAADDMDKALRMEELLNKATRRLQDMELAQFHSPRSRSVSNISTGGVSGGNYTHTWWEALTLRFGFGSDTGAAITAPAASGERRASGKDVTRSEVSSPDVASGDPNPLEKGAILRQLEARMLNGNEGNTTSTAPNSTTSTVYAATSATEVELKRRRHAARRDYLI